MQLFRKSVLSFLALALVLAGCAGSKTPQSSGDPGGSPAAKNTTPLVIAMSREATTLDIHQATGTYTASVVLHLFEGLTHRMPNGDVAPLLAESWKNIDATTWQFNLRKNVKFHNGEVFNGESVKATIKRVLDPAFASKLAGDFAVIDHVDVVNEFTVNLITKYPFPGLPLRLTYLGMVPPKYAAETDPKVFAQKPVGTGPYKFNSWVKGEKIVLDANPDYWQEAPKIPQVIFRVIPEDATRMIALETGEADIVTEVPPSEIKRLSEKKGIQAMAAPTTRSMYLGIDTLKDGPLAKKEVRQALNYAINIDLILDKILMGSGKRLATLVSSQFQGYAADVKPYPYDPAKAKDLLKTAGYPDGFATSLSYVPGAYEGSKEICEQVASDLGKVGIKVEVKPIEAARQLQLQLDKKSEPLIFNGLGGPYADAELLTRISLVNGQRYATYNNKAFDALLLKASSEMDKAKSDATWADVQKMMKDEAPLVFLYQRYAAYAVKKDLKGWEPRLDELVLAYGASK